MISVLLSLLFPSGPDKIDKLQLFPSSSFIDATWGLENPTGAVSWYDVTYREEANRNKYKSCWTKSLSTKNSLCREFVTLSPGTEYVVVVQPKDRNNRDIGTTSLMKNYTRAGEHETFIR